MTNRIFPYGFHHKKCYFILAKMPITGQVCCKMSRTKIVETFSLPFVRYLLFFRFLPFFVSFFLPDSSRVKSAAEAAKEFSRAVGRGIARRRRPVLSPQSSSLRAVAPRLKLAQNEQSSQQDCKSGSRVRCTKGEGIGNRGLPITIPCSTLLYKQTAFFSSVTHVVSGVERYYDEGFDLTSTLHVQNSVGFPTYRKQQKPTFTHLVRKQS